MTRLILDWGTMDLIQAIGLRVKRAREEANLTQTELGDLLGISDNAVSKIELGRSTLRLEHLLALPGILGKPVAYFLELTIEGLTPEEQELLALYRSLPTTGPLRRFVMAQVRAFVLVAQGEGAEEGDEELIE